MVYFIEAKLDDHGLAEKLESKASEIAPQYKKRASKMLFTIENVVKNFIPRGQHCQGKGGTTKSAIKHQLTENGGQVYADENTAPWFKWFHDGRGPVRAQQAKVLHFCVYGQHIFRKSVGPSKANPVMQKGAQEGYKKIKPELDRFAQWITEL